MNTSVISLGEKVKIGAYELSNRIIMAPLTRMRANEDLALGDLHAEYYRQRASAGLIVTEASQISPQAQGYPNTPGIYSEAQIEGWKKVTQAVHDENGRIFIQLWHVGNISHSSLRPDQSLPVAPSAIAANGNAFKIDFSRVPYEIPHALTTEEIKAIVEDYKKAAQNAKDAGFDGVELHAANGYLIEQFLRSVTNKREDEYGGSVENRSRFLFEVLEAILSVWSADKVGIRVSPYFEGPIDLDPNTFELYDYVVSNLDQYNLAYLHLIENKAFAEGSEDLEYENLLVARYRPIYNGTIIVANGFNQERANKTLEKGYADAIAFGTAFISTPDLPYRLLNGLEPNEVNLATVYGGGAEGYTDYPTLQKD